jgi:hypothetical protein
VRFEFLTSTPLSPTEGSGTFVAIDGLVRGLVMLGHEAAVRALDIRTGFHTFDRWLYNARVALAPPVPGPRRRMERRARRLPREVGLACG